MVECRTPTSIIEEFGPPLYVKIDVEHYDQVVLENLFSAGILPPEISAESHSIEIFSRLVLAGYNSFSLVEGNSVARKYGNATIATPSGPVKYSFHGHTSGPFGEDIRSPWEDRETFFHTLAMAGLGWKDIHASKVSCRAGDIELGAREAASGIAAGTDPAGREMADNRPSDGCSPVMAGIELVPFTRDYLERSWTWLNDPEVKRLTMTPDFSRAEQAAFFDSLPGRSDYRIWGVASEAGAPIGAAGIKHIDGTSGEVFLYIGEPACWGSGTGPESCDHASTTPAISASGG